METSLDLNRRTARLAACLFFFIGLPTYAWGPEYSVSKVFVSRDAAATFNNLLANEFIFRTGIVAHLINVIAAAWTALLLYRVFKPVDKLLSRFMIIPPLLQIATVSILELFHFVAVMIAKGEVLMTLEPNQKQEFVYLLLRIHQYGLHAFKFFWALWLLPLGILLNWSGYAPRIIGILSIIGGIGHLAYGCAFFLLQRSDYFTLWPFLKAPMIIGLMAPMLWFLIKGVREQKTMVGQIAT